MSNVSKTATPSCWSEAGHACINANCSVCPSRCSEELGATEMRDLLLESVKALTADLQRYQGLLREAQAERDDALAETRRLRKLVDEWRQETIERGDACNKVIAERDAARAEAERMRSVYVSAIAWRENKYGSSRSWLATREDVDLVSAIDTATTKRGSHGG